MKVLLFGYGNMGQAVEKTAMSGGDEIVGKISKKNCLKEELLSLADVCIDFSSKDCVIKHLELASELNKPIVIGTTGWESHLPQAKLLVEKNKGAALFAPNFSIGVAKFIALLKRAKNILNNYELAGVEYHHAHKKDAPSGTAKKISHDLQMKNDFSSVRCGTIVGNGAGKASE